MVEVVSGRTQLRRASGSRYTGRCPFHEEKTPSFSVNPVDKLYYCFGCGKGGDVISFVRETENLDFVGAVEWLAERFRVPLEYEEASPRVEAERKRRERLYALLDQTTRVLRAAALGRRRGRARARVSRRAGPGRRGREGVPARALARPRAGREGGASGASRSTSCESAGLATVRGGDYFPQRLMFPLARRARARRRLPGAQAPRGRPAAREVRQLARGRPLPQGRDPVRAAPRAGRRSPSRTALRSSRATRTSSRCARPASSRSSRRWGRR